MDGDWNDLRFFLAMVRAGRLTGAARQLGVNHSTVERRITALEQALSAKLFARLPTGFELTAKGQELVPFAEEIESRWLMAASEVSGADVRLSGAVRIGAPDGLGTYFLAKRLANLALKYPGLDLELVAMPQVLNPSKREADIAVSFARPTQGHLTCLKLATYSLSLYASETYLAAHGAPRDIAELSRRPLIGYIKDLIFVRELDYLSDISDMLNPQLTSTNIVAQQIMAQEAYGIAILPDFMAVQSPGLRLVLPDVKLTRTYYISYSNSLAKLLRIRTVIDAMTQWVREARGELFRV